MKKTILTTTLALGLGVTSMTAGQNAEASDYEINKEELAEMAQADSSELNNAPLHEGEYHYDFHLNGDDYTFKSDGHKFSWSYNGGYSEQPHQEVEVQEEAPVEAPNVVEEQPQQQQQTETVEYEAAEQSSEQTEQQTEDVQPAAPEQSSEQPQEQTSENTEQAADGSTKEQFLAAGGSDAMWENIVMPESSGDPNAVNELGYQGLGQTKESWGTGSVEEQTEGMLNYAEERYGSVDEAMEFRNANDWW